MRDNRHQPFDPSAPRRFVYRSADHEIKPAHPLRRATDTPYPLQKSPGESSERTELLKFRVYVKVN